MSGLNIEDAKTSFTANQILPGFIEARDVSAGVLWLASDDSRFVTGLELLIDARWATK